LHRRMPLYRDPCAPRSPETRAEFKKGGGEGIRRGRTKSKDKRKINLPGRVPNKAKGGGLGTQLTKFTKRTKKGD